jgi:pentatricopeptide repeat protein
LPTTGAKLRRLSIGEFDIVVSIIEFSVAATVIEETTRMARYYNILVVAKCKVGNFISAREVFNEMRKLGCDPNANTIPGNTS